MPAGFTGLDAIVNNASVADARGSSREGIVGRLTFGVSGDIVIMTVNGSVVHNGAFAYLETLAP